MCTHLFALLQRPGSQSEPLGSIFDCRCIFHFNGFVLVTQVLVPEDHELQEAQALPGLERRVEVAIETVYPVLVEAAITVTHCTVVFIDLAVVWAAIMIFDVVTFGLTLYKALHFKLWPGGLFTLMLRDGECVCSWSVNNHDEAFNTHVTCPGTIYFG